MEDANAARPAARMRAQPPLKLRMSRILLRRKRQLPQQEFASVWQILGLVEEEDWSGSDDANSSFVFLYAVDFTEIGLEGQLTRDAPVRILAVRPPVLQCPSPVEQHRIGTNLRDYLRRRGQYVAVINAATQVNGLTPLEVRLVQEQEGGRQLTASPTARTVAGYSASMASRFSRSVDVSHHAQLQQLHGALPLGPQGGGLIAPGVNGQQFTPRMSSMRRGMTNSIATNLNV
ncbi:hypothetical protein Emed_000651 [Eimeria media]